MTNKYTLYGAKFSLYSGKARAYLHYKKLDFDEVLSTVAVYKKIIMPETGVKFIPVVKTPDNFYLQDTTNIIDQLELKHPSRTVYPTTPKQKLVSLLLELYGDEWLLIPAMHYRWNHNNFPFIFQEFGNVINPRLPAFIRGFLGKKIGSRFRDIVPLLGVTKKTIPEIEKWYERSFLRDFNHHLSKYPFLLGDKPCIGDFGLFGPLYAHLYRDPYPGQLMKEIAPNVADWVERLKDASLVEGAFLRNDEIPETLLPLLNNLFNVQWPVLVDTADKLYDWTKRQFGDEQSDGRSIKTFPCPRRLGMHDFNFLGIKEQRMVLPHSQWMMQRPLNYYQSLSSQKQSEMEGFLLSINGLEALQITLKAEVNRNNNKFVVNVKIAK
jgi:glutathione S-transferase